MAPSINRNGTTEGKKGASGPASPPIKLIPTLLLIAAGSLEAAVELFGKRLSKRLGLVSSDIFMTIVVGPQSSFEYIAAHRALIRPILPWSVRRFVTVLGKLDSRGKIIFCVVW